MSIVENKQAVHIYLCLPVQLHPANPVNKKEIDRALSSQHRRATTSHDLRWGESDRVYRAVL